MKYAPQNSCGIWVGREAYTTGLAELAWAGGSGTDATVACPHHTLEAAEEIGEGFQGELLGAHGGLGPGVDEVFAVDPRQVVAERLALLAEGVAQEAEEGVAVGDAEIAGPRLQEDDGRVNL